METKTFAILIIFLSIISVTSALSSPACDAYNVALTGNPVMTAVSGNGHTIAIGGANGMIGTFAPDRSPRWVYQINVPVTGIAISEDGRFIAATTFNGDLYYFDEKGRLLWNMTGFGCNSHVALSGNGQEGYIFSRSPTRDLTGDTVFHFTGNGSVLSRLPVPAVTSYALSSDGSLAVVTSGESHGYNYIVGINGAGIQWEKMISTPWRVPDVAISDDCSTVAAIDSDSLTIFSCSGKILGNASTNYIAKSVAVSGNGQHVVVGTQYRVRYFTRSGTQLWEYPVPDYVGHVKVSRDGTKIAATTRQTLYDIDGNGTVLWQYPLPDWTESLSTSGNGNVIAAGTYNNTFTVFDGTGKVNEIDLETVPVMPMVTAVPESPVNTSVVPTRSQSAPVNPIVAVIAFVAISIFIGMRKS
jgi:WD40 repeat protein